MMIPCVHEGDQQLQNFSLCMT